jgi:NADH-quinone oxidoreductase subunit M
MSFLTDHLLTIIVLAPFLACLLLLVIPPERKTAARVTALAAGAIALIGSVAGCLTYDFSAGGYQFKESFDWISFSIHGYEPIRYSVGADGISLVMLLLTGIIIVAGVFASWTVENRTKEYLCLLMFLVTGVFGVFVSLDLFFLFLFYEIAVLPMYLLIGIWGAGRKEYAAMKLTLYLMLGSALILTGILALYFIDPRHTFDMLALSKSCMVPVATQRLLFVGFYLGFGVLAGIFPFHTWSPDGHASAPTAVSMLHAGVLMKLGAYGIIRTCVAMFPTSLSHQLMPYVAIIATINIVYGAFSAMGQKDLKYVIAYSSVSHMGVVMLGIAGMTSVSVAGAVMQMFSHGIMTGLFFALVGLIYEKTHTRDITVMGGLAKQMPGIAVAFAIGGMASFGLPATSGFISEYLVFTGSFAVRPVVTAVAVTGIVITAVYVLRLLQRVFLGPMNERWSDLTDAHSTEWVALGSLATLLVLVGTFPYPLISLIDEGLKVIKLM